MNICLIQPKTVGYDNFPPLGLGYIGTVAKVAGHSVKIIDLEIEQKKYADLIVEIKQHNPKLVGITSTIRSKKEALKIAELLKDYNVVFGGPQSTSEPEEYLKRKTVEQIKTFVLKGESEKTFLKLLDYLDEKISLEQVTNLVYKKGEEVITSEAEPIIKDLDTIPIVDRSIFNLPRYNSKFFLKKATNIITSRGCPFRCSFCFHDFHGKIYRRRSAKNVIAEIEYLYNTFNYRAFIIYDDNFTVDKQRLIDICNLILEKKLKILWRCLSRVNVLDEYLMRLMKKAGCQEIAFGIESSSPETLLRINKMIKPEESAKAMSLCRKVGIVSKAYMMIGFPWETKKMIEDTIDFACQILPYDAQFSVLTPLPNTEIYDQTINMGYEIDRDFDFTRFDPCFETENFTKEEIVTLQRKAVKKFNKAKLIYTIKHPYSHFAFYVAREYAQETFYKLKKLFSSLKNQLFARA
ncbi:MAG: putative Fe-S oxidoreductase [Candidatus Magasanikbacteria bacterium GW2011_GWC2_37_14]|uniref:Putative Fe-S oxidoreductase n=1 Tax=Candidatus Magasanikbacteria bacterium GW2011_GWC2_37_14 TaxID=1619046 RepID=A0A0G0GD35_9BACT|nr:MAG: putative Fe-S oxidoreductase [Candidatus Magasanikbacteria bacterium GW2011_GWC2_37_14]